MNLLRIVLLAAGVTAAPVAATPITYDQTFVPITVPVGNVADVTNVFPVHFYQMELYRVLDLPGSSASALGGELAAFGTSTDEQELDAFGSDTSGGLARDFFLGRVGGLSPGMRYTLTFSFLADPTPPVPGVPLVFLVADPIRFVGDPSGQRLVRTRFATSVTRGDTSAFFVVSRPSDVPVGFQLAQVALERSGVPEPQSWLCLVLGLGAMGAAMRRSTRLASTA